MEKMYQKQFSTEERADFLKDFDLNKDGYVSMKEIKQRTQEKRADFFEDLNLDKDGNIAIKEMITQLNPSILEKKINEKKQKITEKHRPRGYGYLDYQEVPALVSKAKGRSVTALLSASGLEGGSAGPQHYQKFDEKEKGIMTKTSFSSNQKKVGQIVTRTSTTITSSSKVEAESKSKSESESGSESESK